MQLKRQQKCPNLTRVCVCVCVCMRVCQMQGAGAKGWNRLSALFNRDDEHQLLEESEGPPVADQ